MVPHEVWGDMKGYLIVIFIGIPAIFLYNYFASYLRAIGNSMTPLIFLAVSAILNIALDLFFVIVLKLGVEGAAIATVISQYLSGIGISIYSLIKNIQVRAIMKLQYFHLKRVHKVISFSVLTCIQQSVMNLGILMVQGLVNSFGTVVMAAFAAAVKIDAFAYMPVQDFGNAFSTFIAQNYGAKEKMRIQSGLKSAVCLSMGFCIIISTIVCIFAKDLMTIFIDEKETEIIMEGVKYLKIEGAFYCGIGCLFLLYGLYRALGKPGMSVILTIFSLGTRVVLAYVLSAIPAIGVTGIWWSVPIGWALADLIGLIYYRCKKRNCFLLILGRSWAYRKNVIKIAQELDMDIMVYTRTPREDHDGTHYVSLDTLLKNSGYISLHCPLTNYMFVVCLFYIFCFIGNAFVGSYRGIGKVDVPFKGTTMHVTLRVILSYLLIHQFCGFRLWYRLDICEYLSNICI